VLKPKHEVGTIGIWNGSLNNFACTQLPRRKRTFKILCMKTGSKVSGQLFCFHHAGGSSTSYKGWRRFLPASIEIIPIVLPGRHERFNEALIKDFPTALEAVTKMVTPLLNTPFALIGHSMGALLAYEVARNLEQLGTPPCGVFVSGCRAAYRWSEIRNLKSHLSDSALLQEIRGMNGTPEPLLLDAELMELVLPVVRADFSVCDSYKFDPEPFLSCPIFAFGGLDDPDLKSEDIAAWRHLTSGGFRLHMLSGDHFFIYKEWQARQICSVILDNFHSVLLRPSTTGC
jgi:medium-chain acyl-[acyl-carrier-protein] hydrolase